MDTSPPGSRKISVHEQASQRYGMLSPRFWHGMGVVAWTKMLARNQFAISPSRLPMAAAISLFTVGNSLLGLSEKAIFGRRIRKTEIDKPPIFIIGHWRSGTTYLHELLVRDPRHTFPNSCHCFAPLHFLLTERMISRWFGFFLPDKRPMDNVELGWSKPQEDEFALCILGEKSPYGFLAFPDHGPVDEPYLTLADLPEVAKSRWKDTLHQFLKKITLRDDRRIVLKSPPHTGRVRTLLELFPDAKFVHIARDPKALFPSTMRLWQSLSYVQALKLPKHEAWLEAYVLQSFNTMYEQFDKDRELLKENQLVEIRYEDLVQDPLKNLEQIYNQLELGEFDKAKPAIIPFLESKKDYQTNVHTLPEPIEKKINAQWASYRKRYGY